MANYHEFKSHPKGWQKNAFKIQMLKNNLLFLRVIQGGGKVGLHLFI